MNKELIEEAAKEIRDARIVKIRGEDGYLSVAEADSETLARAAFAVFEKARTTSEMVDKSEAGLPNGYFDERRAQIRLEILKGCHGNSGTEIVKNAKDIEAWVLGE